MLELRPIEIEDREKILPLLKNSGAMACTSNFATAFIWGKCYDSRFAITSDRVAVFSRMPDRIAAYPPFGTGDLRSAVLDIIEYSKSTGLPFSFYGVEEKMAQEILDLNLGFEKIERRDYSDYLYDRETLASLAGKAFHGKRGHLKKFKSTYNYKFKAIEKEDIADCLLINEEWGKEHGVSGEVSYEKESLAVSACLSNFDELGAFGVIVRVNGKPAAFTIASRMSGNSEVIDVHFEKAVANYNGIYVFINNEFVNSLPEDIKLINREEDLGIEGLRKAKLSYHPEIILPKYEMRLS